jgi:hypothetical protein
MCKNFLSSLFIIFISQSILFSQDNCEDLTQDECTESLSCSWSIVAMPDGVFEICIENNGGGGEEVNICSEFPADICETMPFCELTADGCIMADFGDDGGDWSDDSTGWNDNLFFSGHVFGNMGPMLPAFEHLAGAIVKLYGGFTGGLLVETETNEEGYFEFEDVATAASAYSVHADGYLTIEGNLYDLCNNPNITECFPIYTDFYLDSENSNLECEDLSGLYFGDCEMVIGIGFNGEECTWYAGCGTEDQYSVNHENSFFESIESCEEACGHGDDGPPECLLDCEGIENINPDEDPYETCDLIISLFGFDFGFASCTEDCDDETMIFINEIIEACYECLENEDLDCADVFEDDGGDDGGWNGECSDLNQEDCEFIDACEWISDSDNQTDATMSGMCVEAGSGDGGDDDPFTCLIDCEGMSDLNPEEDPVSACEWFLGLPDSECIADCNEEAFSILAQITEVCEMCLDGMFDCGDIFDDDGNDDGGDDEAPECLLDCEGIYDVDPDDNPDATCEWLIETLSPNNECTSDCEGETLIGLLQLSGLCEECLTGAFDCADIFDDGGNDNEGYLYGYVEYVWGDAIEMVGGAHVIIQSMSDDNTMIEVYETITNEMGLYEISLPTGLYMVTASAYEDSETHDIYIESGHEYQLNFQLGEWGWPEPQAILSLGDGAGTQEGFTVPLYLQTDTPVSGLQFAVMPEYAGGGFWFTPSELESTNDCFSASFNDVYSQLWGIMFSLEGCVYEPGEHHVANLSFTVAAGSTVPPGTDVHLVFNYTLVSDPGANEIPSSGDGSMVTFGQLGDVNGDGAINVVDIVNMVNFALQIDEPIEYESWAADLNQDGDINVLDIVSVVNIILYGDDLQRSDSGDAEIYHNEKEVHIEGIDVAGFQIAFSDDIDVNQIQIPDGWVSKSHGHSLMAYTLDGNLLNGCSIIKLNQSTEIIELIVVDANGEAIMSAINMLPNMISLKGNFPNPFNPETSISYTLSHDAQVILSVYDLSGRLVETLVDGQQYPGEFLVSWSAHSLPSGMYIARLMVDGESFTQKMMFMK